MGNLYAQICYVYKKMCKKGEGHFGRDGKGEWHVRHVHGKSQHYLKKKHGN